ncbi:unnamed protein product, partial [Timema podura]|nr:unnamed protein product [Timema podura]
MSCVVEHLMSCVMEHLMSCVMEHLMSCVMEHLMSCVVEHLMSCVMEHLMSCLVSSQLPDIESKDPRIKPESYSVAVKLIQEFDQLERQTRAKKGAVLVFLPGIREIEELFNMLTERERASTTRTVAALVYSKLEWFVTLYQKVMLFFLMRQCDNDVVRSELKWWIRPLHSSITVEEQ